MSYLRRNNKLVSTVTKREYDLPAVDPDGSQTRAITQQLLNDNAAVTTAAVQRNQRPLAARERVTGIVTIPDTRSVRERVEQDARLTQPTEIPANRFDMALSAARQALARAHTQDEKSRARRRVELYERQVTSEAAEQEQQRELAEKLADPRRKTALAHAQAELALLSVRADVPESEVTAARSRFDLLTSGAMEPGDYWAQYDASQERLKADRQSKADALDAQAKALRDEAKAIRSGEPAASEPVAAAAEP